MRFTWLFLIPAAFTAASLPQRAQACGGFACSSSPVDQTAERIVFSVRDDHTDMVVQISYQGDDDDFAWILPLVDVPDPASLDTVPASALAALDAGTGPVFQLPPNCRPSFGDSSGGLGCGSEEPAIALGVQFEDVSLFFETEVGPYTAVALRGEDSDSVVEWLRDNQYNVAPAMEPYMEVYAEAGLSFLALRLSAGSTVSDIQPLKLTLPGDSPGIPLRLTTIAAEPEMGLKVWIFADQRYEPANADEVEIDVDALRWEPGSGGGTNNYWALVARAVDRHDGRAWVAEMAGDSQRFLNGVQGRAFTATQEDMQAIDAMVAGTDYGTRLYTRVAPSEMRYDPLFRRSRRGDVDQVIELPYVDSLCEGEGRPPHRCHFAACGQLGLCREVVDESGDAVAACACAPGTSARNITAPDGTTVVSCQDMRLSFMNPGDRPSEGAAPFGDPCEGVECGEHGACVATNLTPTCECDEGYVAARLLDRKSSLVGLRCVEPTVAVPKMFYDLRPAERDATLPVGRRIDLPGRSGSMGNEAIWEALDAEERLPEPASGGGCTAERRAAARGGWLLPLLIAAALIRRREPSRPRA